MKLRTLFVTVVVALVASAPLAALAQKTITFRFNDPEAPQMRAALDEFERRNPGDQGRPCSASPGATRSSSTCARRRSAPRPTSRSSPSSGRARSAAPARCGRSTT